MANEPGDIIRVACVGDSITFGQDIEDREAHCYPAVLQDLLGDGYRVGNFGACGATVLKKGDYPYWKQREFRAATEFDPHIVIIMLGTNDSKPENRWPRKRKFTRDLRALIEHFAALPSNPRIWLSFPPPVCRTIPSPSESVVKKHIIPAITRVARAMDLPTIDIHGAAEGRKDLFPDGVHPNTEGAKLIAETVHKALTADNP